MTRLLPGLLALLSIPAVAGCASGTTFIPVDSPPADQALVYVYRESKTVGWASYWHVHVDGRPAVALENGGYFPLFLAPGDVTLTGEWDTSWVFAFQKWFSPGPPLQERTMTVGAGEAYYLRFDMGEMSGVQGYLHPRLDPVDEEQALQEIQDCTLLVGRSSP